MGKKDPRLDAYIEKAQPFAKPILKHVRKLVHAACPEVTEAIKWGMPHFEYQGTLCAMGAFKAHCAVYLAHGRAVLGDAASDEAMGHLGRVTSRADLPTDAEMTRYIKKAMAMRETAAKLPKKAKPRKPAKALKAPADLLAALKKNKKALAAFEGFSTSHKNEYIEWIEDAKRDETRAKRLATTVEWLSEGKRYNWKYEK